MESLDPNLEQGSRVWPPSLSKNVFLCVGVISYILICVHCFYPVTGNYWREPGSIFFTHSHPIFVNTDKMPLSFLFSKNSPSSPSLFSVSQSLSHLHGTSLEFFQFIVYVRLWGPDLDSVLWECFISAEWRERGPVNLLATFFLI